MKFTLSWLKQFLDTDLQLEEVCNALTAIGLEVEECVDKITPLSSFKVARITEVTKHPEADKLNICKVDNGQAILQIICGAKNVAPGMNIVLASVGDIIPANGMKIEKRKLRGVESQGMICSSEELCLEDSSEGILELPRDLVVGEALVEQVPDIADHVIEIALTPNRSDCLGVYGIARDLAAYGVGAFKHVIAPQIVSSVSKSIDVEIDNYNACPLYISRYFDSVTNSVSSLSVSSLLRSVGEQSISVLVDITNYLMIAFNRPMHIYDADKIVGELVVRNAEEGEKFIALDGKEYELSVCDLVVADDKKVCALAGIIGGEESKCELGTKNIMLEMAVFDHKVISRTARRLGIETGSKHRNERGVDYNFTADAIEIASKKILETCGGQAGDIKIIGVKEKKQHLMDFDISLVSILSGLDISKNKVIQILESLGFKIIKESLNILSVVVPSWRYDINIPEDIVEEVVRIFGYDNIVSLPLDQESTKVKNFTGISQKCLEIKKILSADGYNELITWSFMSSKLSDKLGFSDNKIIIKNPISDNLDQLRASILPNLLQVIKNNSMRTFSDLAFFEIGPIYGIEQQMCVSAVRSGYRSRDSIYHDKRGVDFFDLKKDVLNILQAFNLKTEDIRFFPQEEVTRYHPGKSAVIKYHDTIIGYVGDIHPTIVKAFKLSGSVVAFELFLDKLEGETLPKQCIEFSDYQIVEKDIAFVVDNKIMAGEIEGAIFALENSLIKEFYIFDIYSDEAQLGKNKKSVALKLLLQSENKTLTKEEIDGVFDVITKTIEKSFGGALRTF